jgi:cellulose synthase operon protein C
VNTTRLLLIVAAAAACVACATPHGTGGTARPAEALRDGVPAQPAPAAAETQPELDFAGHIAAGDVAWRKPDPERALFHYSRANGLRPDDALPLLRIGALQESRKDYAAALKAFRMALAVDPRNAGAQERVGYLLLRSGEAGLASAAFAESVRLEPTRWRARLGLSLAAQERGDALAARQHLDLALAEQPRSPELLSHSAELHLQAGDLAAAELSITESLRLAETAGSRQLLGDILARRGDFPGALEAYLVGLAKPAAYARLGEQAMKAGQYERALRYFRQASADSAVHDELLQKRIAVARERLEESRIAADTAAARR